VTGLFDVLIFKLEEEENTALLLHLPKVFAETTVFVSASELRCRLVVAIAQAAECLARLACWLRRFLQASRFRLGGPICLSKRPPSSP
jgi:hypothetical protein